MTHKLPLSIGLPAIVFLLLLAIYFLWKGSRESKRQEFPNRLNKLDLNKSFNKLKQML
jgi:hypothetical protein